MTRTGFLRAFFVGVLVIALSAATTVPGLEPDSQPANPAQSEPPPEATLQSKAAICDAFEAQPPTDDFADALALLSGEGKLIEAVVKNRAEAEGKPAALTEMNGGAIKDPDAPLTTGLKVQVAAAIGGAAYEQANQARRDAIEAYSQAKREPNQAAREQLLDKAIDGFRRSEGLMKTVVQNTIRHASPEAQQRFGLHITEPKLYKNLKAFHETEIGPMKGKPLSARIEGMNTAQVGRLVNSFGTLYDGAASRSYQQVERNKDLVFTGKYNASAVPVHIPIPPVGSRPASAPPPPKEPGGIKFSGKVAQQLARALDVTSVEFNPANGKIYLAGRKTAEEFDLDIFADVLRLAAEEYEPFFSLEPSNHADWQGQIKIISELLGSKFRSERAIAERIRAKSPQAIKHGSRTYYYTIIDLVDADIAKRARAGRDLSVRLVFSPAWLEYSKIGTILYEADLLIKGVAAGFTDVGGIVDIAPVWDIPGFVPKWLSPARGAGGGRANFQLASSTVRQNSTRLDLSEVRPELYMTRTSETGEDTAPTPEDKAISEHFETHWREYVKRVPEIARLEMVFRAYVAARFLIEHHPGLAAKIQRMPRPSAHGKPSLRTITPIVLRAAFENGRAAEIAPGEYYSMGGGFGGGVTFGLQSRNGKKSQVEYVAKADDSSAWWEGLLVAATAGGEAWVEMGDQTAVALEFDQDPLPIAWHARLGLPILGFIMAATAWALFRRQFGWQRGELARICGHCAKVHGNLGRLTLLLDMMTVTALGYFAALPMAAATWEVSFDLVQWASLATLLMLLAVLLVLIGATCGIVVARNRGRALSDIGVVASALLGARVLAFVLLGLLLHGGISGSAIARSYAELLTPAVGERVLGALGGVEIISAAIAVMFFGILGYLLMKWVAPYVFRSRPLAFYAQANLNHAHATAHS